MCEIKLTKDADYLICSLYKSYLDKRSHKMAKVYARELGSSEEIQQKIFPNWSVLDVDDTCRELCAAGLLNCIYSDDTVSYMALTDTGIIYMEERFENKVNTVIDYIAKIKSMIPFI